MTKDVPLTGGNSAACVLKRGNTILKPRTAHDTNVHALLLHLEAKRIDGVPRFLQADDQHSHYSYLPGSTDPPANLHTTPQPLIEAAQLLRRIHDATRDFTPPEPGNWAYRHPDPADCDVIGHSDVAPYNMVFTAGRPTGLFDFDLAGPAPRLRDLAYLAYWLVPLSFGQTDMAKAAQADRAAGSPRLNLICQTYGNAAPKDLLKMTERVLAHMASSQAASAMIGPQAAHRLADGGHFAHWQAEHTAFQHALPGFILAKKLTP